MWDIETSQGLLHKHRDYTLTDWIRMIFQKLFKMAMVLKGYRVFNNIHWQNFEGKSLVYSLFRKLTKLPK